MTTRPTLISMLKSGFDQLTLDSTPRLERARRRLKERDWFAIAREDIETALNEATAEVGGQIPKP